MFKKDTMIIEVLEKAPEKASVLSEMGMHCLGCPSAHHETIEEACMAHGVDVENILEKLNS